MRLAEWRCQILANLSLFLMASIKPQQKFRAFIGDITLMIIWNSSFILKVDMEFSATDTIQHHNLNVSLTKAVAILPVPNSSSIHVLNISSSHFIHVVFDTLSYQGYFDKLCHAGGIFIFSDFKHVGSICSQLIAELMVNHFHKQGMRLGAYVQIILKQYVGFSRIMARFRFSISKCIGYVNLLANTAFSAQTYSRITGAWVKQYPVYYDFPLAMDIKYKTMFWEDNLSHHPSAQAFWETLHVKRESGFCLSIQVVYFDHISYISQPKTMLYLSSFDKRDFSRYEVLLTYFPRLHDSVQCEDGFRLHLDTETNYTNITAQHPDDIKMLLAEAYNTKVHIPLNCLWKGLAFTVRMQATQKDLSPICFSEFGKYLYDLVQPITPSGICGIMYLVPQLYYKTYPWKEVRVSFQKPIESLSCCFYNLVVKNRGTTDCDNFVMLAMPDTITNNVLQWELKLTNLTSHLVWQGNCFRMLPYRDALLSLSIFDICLDVEIYVWGYESGCDMDIELSFAAGLNTFSKPGKLTQNHKTQERSLCSEAACYVTPAKLVNVTSNEAYSVCEGKGGHLLSINSDEEWRFITTHHMGVNSMSTLLQLLHGSIYFTGLRGQVSTVNQTKLFVTLTFQ